MKEKLHHYEESILIPASPEKIFSYVDDHSRFSSHMGRSSWMMGGGSMKVTTDKSHGQKIGSHISLSGNAFGIPISLEEVVTRHDPPYAKTWETIGTPKLLIIGHYIMGVEIKPQGDQSSIRVFINYDLPTTNVCLGKLFSGFYAKWCVQQMINGTRNEFASHPK